MEGLQAKHRKEQRDLQSRITQLKKSATKKTRKGVNDQCEGLTHELRERQARELAELGGDDLVSVPSEEEADLDLDRPGRADSPRDEPSEASAHAVADSTAPTATPSQARKPNRQKARLARRAQEQESQVAEANAEAANLPDLRRQERTSFEKSFEQHGLVLQEIKPDGHCLYSAVADQLTVAGVPLHGNASSTEGPGEWEGYRIVRHVAADFMTSHPGDFEAFLDEPLADHVHKVGKTAEWGGQLELLALARAYGVQINVLQGDGRIEKIEPDEDGGGISARKEIWLGYYRQVYGLGEHYNSLRRRT